jgi:hypothetical protein
MYLVLRPFREGGRDLKPGDKVDATLWLNTPLLEQQRYLRELPNGDPRELPEERAARTPKAAERKRRSS